MIRRLWRRLFKRSPRAMDAADSSPHNSASRFAKSDHELKQSADFWEVVADVCAGFVVLGIIWEDWPKFLAVWSHPTPNSVLDLAAGLFVILGIAGEIIFARSAARKQDELYERNQLRIAELKLLAENQALARAKLEESLAQTALLLEQEKTERIKLEKQFAWRRITFNQELRIKSLLNGYLSGHTFCVYASIDPESWQLMKVICSLLKSSQWKQVPTPGVTIQIGGPAPATPWIGEGLCIQCAPSEQAGMGPIARAVAAIFSEVGLGMNAQINPELGNQTIFTLLVGSKPQPPEPERKIDS